MTGPMNGVPVVDCSRGTACIGAPASTVRRTLVRLCRLRLLAAVEEFGYLVRLSAPPVSGHPLERLPALVAELHRRTLGVEPNGLVA